MRKLSFFLVLLFSVTSLAYAQWEFFEHRYKYKLSDVLEADRFIKKDLYWEGYRNGKIVGYVFLSKQLTADLVGYSGKHMETLVGMDTDGRITGVKVIYHSEPIVLIGLKEDNYKRFIKQYSGKSIKSPLKIGKDIAMDAITGATVTAVVQNAIITGSARKIASKVGILEAQGARKKRGLSTRYVPMTWKELLREGAVKNLRITNSDLGLKGDDIYLDLYFGLAVSPSIGRNVLGEKAYSDLMGRMKEGESAIFVFGRGKGSFKGSGYARGGIFDRFNIEQNNKVFVFKDKDYRIMTEIAAEGSPDIKEGGIFIVRGKEFDPASAFRFTLTLPVRIGAKKIFRSFTVEYVLPERFLERR